MTATRKPFFVARDLDLFFAFANAATVASTRLRVIHDLLMRSVVVLNLGGLHGPCR